MSLEKNKNTKIKTQKQKHNPKGKNPFCFFNLF